MSIVSSVITGINWIKNAYVDDRNSDRVVITKIKLMSAVMNERQISNQMWANEKKYLWKQCVLMTDEEI